MQQCLLFVNNLTLSIKYLVWEYSLKKTDFVSSAIFMHSHCACSTKNLIYLTFFSSPFTSKSFLLVNNTLFFNKVFSLFLCFRWLVSFQFCFFQFCFFLFLFFPVFSCFVFLFFVQLKFSWLRWTANDFRYHMQN